MATVIGSTAKSIQVEDLRSNQSVNIWVNPDDHVELTLWDLDNAAHGTLVDTQPVSEIPQTVVGDSSKSLSGNSDFYNRILIEPNALDLGNLLNTQNREIRVWNGYFVPKTIASFQASNADGIDITEPVMPPYVMASTQELTYLISITTDGPPVIDAAMQWQISGEDYVATITGRRVVVFPYGPDWKSGITESLEWKTNVLRSFDGGEQRRAVRTKPRRMFEYRMMARGKEAQRLENLLWGWQNRMYAMPVWTDKTRLNTPHAVSDFVINVNTTGYCFVRDGLAIIYSGPEQYEVVEIDTVNATNLVLTRGLERAWDANSLIFPAVVGNLPNAFPITRYTGSVLQASVRFQSSPVETDPFLPTAAAPTTYLGLDVLTRQPNWVRPLDNTFEYAYDMLDQGTGAVRMDPTEEFPRIMRRYSWLLRDREQILDFRELLRRLRGQAKTMWVPSWHLDFTVVQTILAGDVSIDVDDNSFALMVGEDPARNHICLRLENGQVFYRQITGVQQLTGKIRLGIGASLGVTVQPADVRALHILNRSRLATDKVDIAWRSNEVATVETTIITVRE